MVDNYREYINSDEWKALRKELIIRAEGCCELCGEYVGQRGEAHHDDYDNLFNETLEDLTYCCEECHPQSNRVDWHISQWRVPQEI